MASGIKNYNKTGWQINGKKRRRRKAFSPETGLHTAYVWHGVSEKCAVENLGTAL